jgi:hypothetical protein
MENNEKIEMMNRIFNIVNNTYISNANKMFKKVYVSEFSAKIFSLSDRSFNVKPHFSKSSPKTILYSFVVVDGMKSVAIGHIIYKAVR